MKQILWISAIAVTAFALTLNTFAQPPGGGQRGQGGQGGQGQRGQQGPQGGPQMGGQTNPQQLLSNPEVVTLLGLTEEQTTALREAAGQPGERGERPQGLTPGQTPTAEQIAQFAEQRRQRTTEQWANLNKVLNEEQQKKFKEIYFQANNGLNSTMLNEWVLAAVNLTDDQKKKVADIITARDAELRTLGGGGPQGGGQEQREARTALNTKYADQIKAVLTAEQKAAAEKLTEGAAELRTKLGIGQPGQGRGQGQEPGQGRGQGRGQGGQTGDFVPGSNAWQPGQDAPAASADGGNRGNRAGFPRNSN